MHSSRTVCTPQKTVHNWTIENFENAALLIDQANPLICYWTSDEGDMISTKLYKNSQKRHCIAIGLRNNMQPVVFAHLDFNVCWDRGFMYTQHGSFERRFNTNHEEVFELDLDEAEFSQYFTLTTTIYFRERNRFFEERTPTSGGVSCSLWAARLLNEMFSSETLTDCVLKMVDAEIKAHRCVLAQNSQVFRAMFSHESTVESKDGIIDINDSDNESVTAMVKFMYTGSIVLDHVDVKNVLFLAEKYDLQPLKEACVQNLENTLTPTNVLETAVIASRYQSQLLIERCATFLNANLGKVSRSEEWARFKATQPEFVFQLLERSATDH